MIKWCIIVKDEDLRIIEKDFEIQKLLYNFIDYKDYFKNDLKHKELKEKLKSVREELRRYEIDNYGL